MCFFQTWLHLYRTTTPGYIQQNKLLTTELNENHKWDFTPNLVQIDATTKTYVCHATNPRYEKYKQLLEYQNSVRLYLQLQKKLPICTLFYNFTKMTL